MSNHTNQVVSIEPLIINGVKYIRFKVEDKEEIFEYLRKLEGIIWDRSLKAFIIPDGKGVINRIFNHIRMKSWFLDYSKLKSHSGSNKNKKSRSSPGRKTNISLPETYQNHLKNFKVWMKQCRYAENTINSYLGVLVIFFNYYKDKPIEELSKQDIEEYNYNYILRNGYSRTFQNQTINAIKLFYIKMHNIKHELNELERPRRARVLPKVIPKEDIQEMLSSIGNLKHRVALAVIYGLGLRRGELINLKLSDIDSKRKTVIIRNAKGSKDRALPIPDTLLDLIIRYYKVYKPVTWLIEGQKEGTKYSAGSLQNIFKKYFSRVDKNRSFTLHCLRHSCATHLLESGTDIRYIQELLGHKSSRTTEIYTYVSMRSLKNIKNPIDDFDL